MYILPTISFWWPGKMILLVKEHEEAWTTQNTYPNFLKEHFIRVSNTEIFIWMSSNLLKDGAKDEKIQVNLEVILIEDKWETV